MHFLFFNTAQPEHLKTISITRLYTLRYLIEPVFPASKIGSPLMTLDHQALFYKRYI
jgi:hypothetical protein